MRTEPNPTRLDRVFARLDREPERPAHVSVPGMSRHRVVLFSATLGFYAAIVVAVLTTSWLVRLDWQVMFFRPYQQWPELHAYLDYYVVLGQRGPTAVMVAAWLGWRSWRQRTLRPMLTLGMSLLLLNVTVGAAKLGMGRLGPHYATVIGSNEMWLGGDIFPSGHTANAVVTWGILAYLAATPRARRYLSALSAVVSLGVGLTTVYLGTHWLSDVLLGWAAGLLILLALPWFEPLVARAERWLFGLRDTWRRRRAAAGAPASTAPVATPDPADGPPPVRIPGPAQEPATPETVGAPHTGRAQPRPAPGGHTPRPDRAPGTPVGGRRGAHHQERPGHGTPPTAVPAGGPPGGTRP